MGRIKQGTTNSPLASLKTHSGPTGQISVVVAWRFIIWRTVSRLVRNQFVIFFFPCILLLIRFILALEISLLKQETCSLP